MGLERRSAVGHQLRHSSLTHTATVVAARAGRSRHRRRLCTRVPRDGRRRKLSGQYWLDRCPSQGVDRLAARRRTVAVVDSGVDATVGDLRGRVLPGVNLSGRRPRTDAATRAPAVTSTADASATERHGACSSPEPARESASPASLRRRRSCPSRSRPATERTSTPGTSRSGIRWAVDHGADIVNVSSDRPGSCDPGEAVAVKYAYQHDVPVIASTGNVGEAVGSPGELPGRHRGRRHRLPLRAVAADQLRPADGLRGSRGGLPQETNSGKKLTGGSGTSAATAIVSATFALMKAHFPDTPSANCSPGRSTTSTTARTSSGSASTTSSGTARSCRTSR